MISEPETYELTLQLAFKGRVPPPDARLPELHGRNLKAALVQVAGRDLKEHLTRNFTAHPGPLNPQGQCKVLLRDAAPTHGRAAYDQWIRAWLRNLWPQIGYIENHRWDLLEIRRAPI